MNNFFKRFITSLSLLLIIYIAIKYEASLFILFVMVSFIVQIEIYNLLKKIFYKQNSKIFFLYLLSIVYLLFFIPQLYLYIIFDFNNKLFFIFVLTICIATDVGGYFFGKLFKGKKLTKISPNKTYSGLIGSYFFSLIVYFYFYFYFNFLYNFAILAIFISTISQIGDLFISFLKRKANVKDTGNFLPGHGGILDRIDGIIFAIPIGINLLFLFK